MQVVEIPSPGWLAFYLRSRGIGRRRPPVRGAAPPLSHGQCGSRGLGGRNTAREGEAMKALTFAFILMLAAVFAVGGVAFAECQNVYVDWQYHRICYNAPAPSPQVTPT